MLILAGVSINAIVGDNGILKNAQVSTLASKFSAYKEQLELNAFDDDGVYASGDTVKKYIPTLEDDDLEKFVIMKRELMYIENDKLEIEAARKVGIQTADTGEEGSASAIQEVKAVISGVVNLGSGFNVPEDDFTETTNTNDNSKGLVGIRLYDKNSVNSETWNIVIEYDNSNKEMARYGSGYYWLKAGETYIIDGQSMKFENDFIVDYANKQYTVLSGRAVNWNLNSTIAVTEGMVLNLDPMTFADGEWITNEEDSNFKDFYVTDTRTGRKENKQIQKTGDVEYDASTKSLMFNESPENTLGEGGYIKLDKSDVDFSKGFTFEFYSNLSRMEYNSDFSIKNGVNQKAFSLFCRIEELNVDYRKRMWFGKVQMNSGYWGVAKFFEDSNVILEGDKFCVPMWGNVSTKDGIGYNVNEDFYLTFVYTVYDPSIVNERYDEKMIQNSWDKVEYYINGVLYGYTYYNQQTYNKGLNNWNDAPFFIGVGPCWAWNNLYYMKGKCYTTRLYTTSMTPDQVKDNYNTTLKYRSSF